MSRRKRHVDEEDFDEYAFYDERIRGDAHRRLDDGPPALQDYGLGPGYLGRARQSPRSPSIAGDDEIRPARRRNASPDDSDRGGERRAFRKVGDAYDPDDVFDEPFVFIEPGGAPVVTESQVKRVVRSSVVYRDWLFNQVVAIDADAVINGNVFFLRQQRVLDSDSGGVTLNNLQLRGAIYVGRAPTDPFPEAVFVEVAVIYDRSRSFLSGHSWNGYGAASYYSWSDVFGRSGTTFTDYATLDNIDTRTFHFTNPETSSRFRIMFRKMYKLDFRTLRMTYFTLGGLGTNADPLLNYSYGLEGQFFQSDGGPIQVYDPRASSCVLIDEFVNLCSLPARYRAGGTLDTAVDTEGGISVAVRCSHPTGDSLKVLMNTRLNLSVDPSTSVKFY